MAKRQPGFGGWLGLIIMLLGIVLLVILVFFLITRFQPGFFQSFSPIV